MRRLALLLGLLVLALPLAACSPTYVTTGPTGTGTVPVDSLHAEIARLRDVNRALRDSLRFHDDVETGQYHRDLRTLQDHLTHLTYEVRLLRDGGLPVARLPTDSLFEPASATVRPVGIDRLRALARQLQSTYPDRTVRVEGHADDTPLSDSLQQQFPSNWELSAARATAVVRHLIELTDLDRSQFVAVGYGSTRPRASNETAGGRRRNRRVRVAVLPVPRDYSSPPETTW